MSAMIAAVLIAVAAFGGGPQVIDKISKAYGITRERTQHKIKLMVNALIRERDIG